MKRWSVRKGMYVENEKVDAFIAEVLEVSKRHETAF